MGGMVSCFHLYHTFAEMRGGLHVYLINYILLPYTRNVMA